MKAPTVTLADVERLVRALEEGGGHMSAGDLALVLFGAPTEGNKRRVRVIVRATGAGIVSYPGSSGYKLWKCCSVDELHQCVAAWNAQIDTEKKQRDIYRARLHREHPVDHSRPEPEDLRPSSQQLSLL